MKELRPGGTRLRLHGDKDKAQGLRVFAMRKLQGFLATCNEDQEVCGPWKVEFSDGSWVKLSQLYDQPVIDIFVPFKGIPEMPEKGLKRPLRSELVIDKLKEEIEIPMFVPGFLVTKSRNPTPLPSHATGHYAPCGNPAWGKAVAISDKSYQFEAERDGIDRVAFGLGESIDLLRQIDRDGDNDELELESIEVENEEYQPGLEQKLPYKGRSIYIGYDYADHACWGYGDLYEGLFGSCFMEFDGTPEGEATWAKATSIGYMEGYLVEYTTAYTTSIVGNRAWWYCWDNGECLRNDACSDGYCDMKTRRTMPVVAHRTCAGYHQDVDYFVGGYQQRGEYINYACYFGQPFFGSWVYRETILHHVITEHLGDISEMEATASLKYVQEFRNNILGTIKHGHSDYFEDRYAYAVHTHREKVKWCDKKQEQIETTDEEIYDMLMYKLEELNELESNDESYIALYVLNITDSEVHLECYNFHGTKRHINAGGGYIFWNVDSDTGYNSDGDWNPGSLLSLRDISRSHWCHPDNTNNIEYGPFHNETEIRNNVTRILYAEVCGEVIELDRVEGKDHWFNPRDVKIYDFMGTPVYMYGYVKQNTDNEDGSSDVDYIRYGYFMGGPENHVRSEEYKPAGYKTNVGYNNAYHRVQADADEFYAWGACAGFKTVRKIEHEYEHGYERALGTDFSRTV